MNEILSGITVSINAKAELVFCAGGRNSRPGMYMYTASGCDTNKRRLSFRLSLQIRTNETINTDVKELHYAFSLEPKKY